ncbi:hypothetical protein [Devosia sp. CAU 1758]
MAGKHHRAGFDEGFQRGFALDDAVAFRGFMLGLYDERCAVTGRAVDADGESLELFLFQPLSHGGTMSTGNAMVVEAAVASLLGKGLIFISDDFLAYTPHPEIIGAPSDPERSRGRRLWLPEEVSLWPERSMIGYHRSLFRAQ